jgi:hypothetical protein
VAQTPLMTIETRPLGILLACFTLTTALPGCQTEPFCAERGHCGGDLMPGAADFVILNALHEPPPGMDMAALDGTPGQDSALDSEWSLSGGCMDEVKSTPTPLSQVRQPAKPAGERPVERTLPDWCSSIVLSSDGVVKAYDAFYTMLLQNEGWFPAVPIAAGALRLSRNGRYQVKLTQRLAQRVELSASCLSAQGASLTCTAFAGNLQAFIATQLTNFTKDPSYRAFEASASNVACADADAGGCVCDYDLFISGGPSGRYAQSGSQITFFDDQYRPPSLAQFCSTGAALEISSEDQTRLFNKADLRNTAWRKPSCQDGVQSLSLGETGIDCGGSCAACPM